MFVYSDSLFRSQVKPSDEINGEIKSEDEIRK